MAKRAGDWRRDGDADAGVKAMQDDYLKATDPARIKAVSDLIDHFYDQDIDIFETWHTGTKPRRYHVLVAESTKAAFPPDRPLLERFEAYGRYVFGHMLVHERNRLFLQALLLILSILIVQVGAGLLESATRSAVFGGLIAVVGLAAVFGLYVFTGQMVQRQYRYELQNDALAASRPVLERTKDLHNIFTESRTLADQAETDFGGEAKGWGQRAKYLTRLSMWIGERMEYLEQFIQMELWRTRREWWFLKWASRIGLVLALGVWIVAFAVVEFMPGHAAATRVLAFLLPAIGGGAAWMSWRYWETPMDGMAEGLGVPRWVRHGDLNVDDSIADQVRRDKERLVEYRTLKR